MANVRVGDKVCLMLEGRPLGDWENCTVLGFITPYAVEIENLKGDIGAWQKGNIKVLPSEDVGTLKELKLREGDEVVIVDTATESTKSYLKTFEDNIFVVEAFGGLRCEEVDNGFGRSNNHQWRVVKRVNQVKVVNTLAYGQVTVIDGKPDWDTFVVDTESISGLGIDT